MSWLSLQKTLWKHWAPRLCMSTHTPIKGRHLNTYTPSTAILLHKEKFQGLDILTQDSKNLAETLACLGKLDCVANISSLRYVNKVYSMLIGSQQQTSCVLPSSAKGINEFIGFIYRMCMRVCSEVHE